MTNSHLTAPDPPEAASNPPPPLESAEAPAESATGLPPRPDAHAIITAGQWSRIATALSLSRREVEVVQHIFAGEVESHIAFKLGISIHTVHTYVKRIYAKLGVSDHRELIIRIVAEHLDGMSPEQGT